MSVTHLYPHFRRSWGILQCFDECAEIATSVLEALRTPLEDGEIRLARRDGVARYPARFQLVMAANPCPCAPTNPADCLCNPGAKRRYLGKLSGPLMDRVDLKVEMHAIRSGAFTHDVAEPTAAVRDRVAMARATAAERWQRLGVRTNAEVPGTALRTTFRPGKATMAVLRAAVDRGKLNLRGADRTLRIAWSIADLGGAQSPTPEHVATALSFRQGGAR
ncbi:ATP-binding protein [Mycolicibacterium sp. PDY-3]|uniref:ATP-binding protein n=1 Tax=Mycolicibacterium sp. PDY-3 TaxID=3376069 RepID=UPI00379E58EA